MKAILLIALFQLYTLTCFSQEVLNKWNKIEKYGWKDQKYYWMNYYSPDSSSFISLYYDSLNNITSVGSHLAVGTTTSYYDSTTIPDYKDNGTFVKFHDNYKVKLVGNYYLGNPIGTWIYYYASGQVERIENYPSDNLIYTLCESYSTSISDIDPPINSKGEPTMMSSSSHYIFQSLPHGDWVEYYENGYINSIKKFNMGLATGTWTWYHDNGKKKKEGQFFEKYEKYPCKADTLTGYLTPQQEEELMATEGVIQLQPKHGKWKSWDKQGTLILIEEYDKGKLIK